MSFLLRAALAAWFGALWLLPPAVSADEIRPALLELTERGSGVVEVYWTAPMTLPGLVPELPASCRPASPVRRADAGSMIVRRWTSDCPNGLAGQSLSVRGLGAGLSEVLVRVAFAGGSTEVLRLLPSVPVLTLPAGQGRAVPVLSFGRLGMQHIWSGPDHLLFVLGLCLLVAGPLALLKTITAFTVAHSLTLALAVLGIVAVPQAPVEAAIALSIVYVALELVRRNTASGSLSRCCPWVVALSFGLLHGLGFAGALTDIGLPRRDLASALLGFNLGVEAGQVVFVAAVLLAQRVLGRYRAELLRFVRPVAAYGIGSVAAFWMIDRMVMSVA